MLAMVAASYALFTKSSVILAYGEVRKWGENTFLRRHISMARYRTEYDMVEFHQSLSRDGCVQTLKKLHCFAMALLIEY